MKTTDVNESLIGKKVKGIFTGLEVVGEIVGIIEDEYCKGVRIFMDEEVNWGGSWYRYYESTARKSDNWGNLNHTELI